MRIVARVAAVLGYVTVVCVLLAWLFWTLLVVWGRTDTTYVADEPEAWQRRLAGAGIAVGRVSLIAGVVLVAAVVLAVVAARRDREGWMSLGIVIGLFSLVVLLNAGLTWASFVSRVNAALASFQEYGTSTPPRFEPPTRHDARVEIDRMVRESLDAVVDPWDAEGHRLAIGDVPVTSSPCHADRYFGDVTQYADLALRTADPNAASDILAAWDEAGYDDDRDGQDAVRYSDLLPIKRMTLHDTTATDGFVRLHIESQCSKDED
ncbi:hypothetical protein PU630_03695 [Microbacterium horticulturae]|uniref:Uncharacterized protein n=1 Tax=Microbacterium horticulturae TaxID=3028316 RepID=A0ABY8BZP4_9MICO|nr:hypothetical protein [Microbacterium sp. KACC 23027]WEG09681.1 hypothetical protein PU630_03695 [Microbacterium sp. KACC 23027]